MNFMKMKKGLPIILAGALLICAGCQSEAAVKKNELITEKNTIGNVQVSEKLSKEELKEIAIKAFQEHFNRKVDTTNLFEQIEEIEPGYWHMSWSTFNISKFEKANKKLIKMKNNGSSEEQKKLVEEFKELQEGYNTAITYSVRIESDGDIKRMEISDRSRDENKSTEEIKETEIKIEEKAIALNAIEEFAGKKVDVTNLNELITMDDNSWEFYWDNKVDWDANEKRSINYGITIDRQTKEVKSITYIDEVVKQHKTNSFPGFNIEEGKKIALDFIKEHGYVEDINDVKFLRNWNADPQIVLFTVDYIYGKDNETGKTKVIKVTVNKRTKEVWGISKTLETDEQLKSKDHERTNKTNPNALG